jgi:hypothetical protein
VISRRCFDHCSRRLSIVLESGCKLSAQSISDLRRTFHGTISQASPIH